MAAGSGAAAAPRAARADGALALRPVLLVVGLRTALNLAFAGRYGFWPGKCASAPIPPLLLSWTASPLNAKAASAAAL